MISFNGVTIGDEHLTAIDISEGAITVRGTVKTEGYGRLLESMLASHRVGDIVIFECVDFSGREFSGVGTITELETTARAANHAPEFSFVVTITAGVQKTS